MKNLLPFSLLFLTFNLLGQNQLFEKTYRLSSQVGHVFATNSFLKGQNSQKEPITEMWSLSMSMGQQTTGKQYWQENYQYPLIGGGIYVASFTENKKELGTPIALYGFFSAPFVRRLKWAFNYDLQLGMAFNWKPFNPLANPNNISIGSKQSVYIDLGLHFDYWLSKNLSLELGGSLSHFSNGALKKPNFGINTVAPKLSIAYRPGKSYPTFITSEIPPAFLPQTEWNFSIFTGFTNVVFDSLQLDIIEKYEGVNFPTFGVNTGINRQISRKSKIGLGFTLEYHTFYQAAVSVVNNEIVKNNTALSNKLAFSIFPSYELVIDRLSILLQPGFYLYRNQANQPLPVFYQRLGVKYHVNPHFFVGANLRAFNLHISDFIEWNVGFRFKVKK